MTAHISRGSTRKHVSPRGARSEYSSQTLVFVVHKTINIKSFASLDVNSSTRHRRRGPAVQSGTHDFSWTTYNNNAFRPSLLRQKQPNESFVSSTVSNVLENWELAHPTTLNLPRLPSRTRLSALPQAKSHPGNFIFSNLLQVEERNSKILLSTAKYTTVGLLLH